MNQHSDGASPVTLFYSYAHEDEALRDELENHLALLRRQGIISSWYDRQIVPGTDWSREIDVHLNAASIILLLISPDFLASDYCYSVEMRRALARHESGEAQVIPIILRPVDWQDAPFASLQGLPRDMKPVTSWPNRDEAFLDIAKGIRWTIEHLRGISENEHQASLLMWRHSLPSTSQELRTVPVSSQVRQNRQRFLTYLHTRYREVQEQSLQGVTSITLELRTKPDAITHLARLVFRHLNEAEQVLPPGTSIEQVYAHAGGELLILGEPGAGKSTLLLELAQSLLMHAEHDEEQPLPVILNLSSWAEKRYPLREWLAEELLISYQVPRKLGKLWAQEGTLLLLLDGLDEVEAAARGACIETINAYRRDHLLPLVVCSRTTEYLSQQRRLLLQSAVVIQPLTQKQIDEYLMRVGPQLSSLGIILHRNEVLRELAASPLMLNVLVLAYQGDKVTALSESGSPEEQQRQVFVSYVRRMLQSNEAGRCGTSPQRMLRGLAWLARQLCLHGQSVFYLEQLQPNWLSENWMLQVYERCAVLLPNVFMGALVCVAINMFFYFTFSLPLLIESALIGGLLGGVLSGGSRVQQSGVEGQNVRGVSWNHLLRWLGTGALIGLSIWLSFRLPNESGTRDGVIDGGVSDALSLGLCSVLLQIILTKRNTMGSQYQMQYPSSGTKWSYLARSLSFKNGLLTGLLVGLAYGISSGLNWELSEVGGNGLSFAISDGIRQGLTDWLGYGLTYGFTGAFLSILLVGNPTGIRLTDMLVWSWGSLRRSLFSKKLISVSLQVAVLIGLLVGLDYGLSWGLRDMLIGLDSGLFWGLSAGLIGILSYGIPFGLIYGLSGGLSYWLLFGFFRGIASETIEDQRRAVPNQGIIRSIQNSFMFGLVSMLIVGVISILSIGMSHKLEPNPYNVPIDWLGIGLSLGLIIAPCAGILVGVLNGGLACWRHYVLRFLLWRTGAMPWNYVQSLDEAARCILLSKVGGGYSFIHRLFQDYIASLDTHFLTSLDLSAPLSTSSSPSQEASVQEQRMQPQE